MKITGTKEKSFYLFATKPDYEAVLAVNGLEANLTVFILDMLSKGFMIRLSDVEEFNAFEPTQRGKTFYGDKIQSISKSRQVE